MQSGQVVLDLGSSAGIDLLLAAKKVGPSGRAIGVDMTDEMIAKSNETIAAAGLTNIEVRKGVIDVPGRTHQRAGLNGWGTRGGRRRRRSGPPLG